MHFDIWALHLETMSPELQYEEERSPSWVAHMGWVAELQVRRGRGVVDGPGGMMLKNGKKMEEVLHNRKINIEPENDGLEFGR